MWRSALVVCPAAGGAIVELLRSFGAKAPLEQLTRAPFQCNVSRADLPGNSFECLAVFCILPWWVTTLTTGASRQLLDGGCGKKLSGHCSQYACQPYLPASQFQPPLFVWRLPTDVMRTRCRTGCMTIYLLAILSPVQNSQLVCTFRLTRHVSRQSPGKFKKLF